MIKLDRSRPGPAVMCACLAIGLVAVPVLSADPSPDPSRGPSSSGGPIASEAPSLAPSEPQPSAAPQAEPPDNPAKPDKPFKADKVPSVPVTVSGTVRATTDADGAVAYTLNAGGTTYQLEAGPGWWWGADHPLADFVGESVQVAGEQAEGSSEIDVQAVGGVVIRAAGKPPWAGGWRVVGERHPGWAQWKVDKLNGNPGHGKATAPGQLKDKDATTETPTGEGAQGD